MSLAAWQGALAQLVLETAAGRGDAPPTLSGWDLEPGERAWLAGLVGTPGLQVTAEIQRFWRVMRLRTAAPLTLAALGERAEALLARYAADVPARSLFFHLEALDFLAWLEGADLGRLAQLARLERALLETAQEPGPCPVELLLDVHPDQLLLAVLRGEELPPPEDGLLLVRVGQGGAGRWTVEAASSVG